MSRSLSKEYSTNSLTWISPHWCDEAVYLHIFCWFWFVENCIRCEVVSLLKSVVTAVSEYKLQTFQSHLLSSKCFYKLLFNGVLKIISSIILINHHRFIHPGKALAPFTQQSHNNTTMKVCPYADFAFLHCKTRRHFTEVILDSMPVFQK